MPLQVNWWWLDTWVEKTPETVPRFCRKEYLWLISDVWNGRGKEEQGSVCLVFTILKLHA